MLIGGSNSADLDNWQKQIKMYEKSKRTKKPFGGPVPVPHIVTEKEKKLEQNIFNPVLQTFAKRQQQQKVIQKQETKRAQSLLNQMRLTSKYQKPYDIVNLYPPKQDDSGQVFKQSKAPLRYNFNIVSNQPLPDCYFKNTIIKLTDKPEKRNEKIQVRDYNILTNEYNQNNQQRKIKESQQVKQQIQEKYRKTHQFNPVIGTFYDSHKQEQYLQELQKQMKQHGKDNLQKLPPSYVYRQRFVADPTKEIPQQVKQLQLKNKNAKKRYELKYKIEREYADRNIEHDLKEAAILKNKIHDGKVIEDQKKQFNIINLNDYDMEYKLDLYGKKPMGSTWDKITKTRNKQSNQKNQGMVIKTGGFN